jgi:hypothetical protein
MKIMIGTYIFRYHLLLFLLCDSSDSFIFSAADRAEIVKSVKVQSGTGCVFYIEFWDQNERGEFRKSKKREPNPELFSETAVEHIDTEYLSILLH